MLHHVSVGVKDVARAATFYDPVLKALGYKRVVEYLPVAIGYGESKDRAQFWIGLPHNQSAATSGNGAHIGFIAKSKAAVNKFHEAALRAGGSNNGEPGPRPDYGPHYYGAFIYDLDGNKIEAALMPPKANAKPAKKTAKKKKTRLQ
jgi:catechol 2,3-dioxygenase-like lactoylglutathione lyase family enzyme